MLQFDQPHGKLRAVLIAGDRFVDAVRIRPQILLEGIEQARRGQHPQQLPVIRRSSSPVLREIPVDARGYGHRPVNIRSCQMSSRRDIPQRRNLDIFRIPIPAVLILAQRIKRIVGIDPVLARRSARNQGGVAGIRNRRYHSMHAGRVSTFAQKAPEVRNLQSVRIRFSTYSGLRPSIEIKTTGV